MKINLIDCSMAFVMGVSSGFILFAPSEDSRLELARFSALSNELNRISQKLEESPRCDTKLAVDVALHSLKIDSSSFDGLSLLPIAPQFTIRNSSFISGVGDVEEIKKIVTHACEANR